MKKFIVCALFAWWFVAVSTSSVNQLGPFDTKEACESVKKSIAEVGSNLRFSKSGIGLSSCFEAKALDARYRP
ncbi:MAG: hypothetical protein Q8O83_00205 [bacterium]|nr:hypothetical protein [bacterium]